MTEKTRFTGVKNGIKKNGHCYWVKPVNGWRYKKVEAGFVLCRVLKNNYLYKSDMKLSCS